MTIPGNFQSKSMQQLLCEMYYTHVPTFLYFIKMDMLTIENKGQVGLSLS